MLLLERDIVYLLAMFFINHESANVYLSNFTEVGNALCCTIKYLYLCSQGDLGPFNPGLPIDVPVWLALNLKQRQKCRIIPPEWMDVGKVQSFS